MPVHAPQPGDLVGGKYRLERLIGTGGMGAVWSAAVSSNSADAKAERVAIKFLHAQMAADPLVVQRFLLEARAGTEIRHPNVVCLLASGWLESSDDAANAADGADATDREEAVPWIAMELLSGKTLSDVLRLRPRLEAVDALALMTQVTAGAAAAHAAKIVHRDLKPANVFLQREKGSVGKSDEVEVVIPKILDFGISKFVDPNLDGGLTTTGAIVGSAMYMSPEQAMGGYQVDLRSDVWSLGILLYRTLTGESPLPSSHQEIMLALASPKELNLSALRNTRIPPSAASAIRRCLRKKREERFGSASELEAELRVALDDASKTRPPDLAKLLHAPTTSSAATLIAAPIALEGGESTTASSTAPTGLLNASVPVPSPPSPLSDESAGLDALPVASTLMAAPSTPASFAPASPSVPVGSPNAVLAPTKTTRRRITIAAGLLVIAVFGLVVWRIGTKNQTPETPVATTTPPATDSPPTENATAAASAIEIDPAAPTTTSRPRSSKPRIGIGPHPTHVSGPATKPPTTTAPSAPEPWRRPGF